ncbi:MAG: Crp/Fnr family transcriptional regulator [Saprospiraceae bacterium]|nr:Crp/Fnr family transcriptional regulator [Saprospiraceae bacterium]
MSNSGIWFLQNIDATEIFCPTKMAHHDGDKHNQRVFKKGESIYLPEDEANKIYFIQQGRVKIRSQGGDDKEIIKAVLGKGEIFGEMALIKDDVRRDQAVAMEETSLCIVDKDDINSLMPSRNGLQNFFLNLFGARILEMENRLESLVFKDSRSRIVHFLLELADKKGEAVGFETVVRKFLTHQEIANLTATSRQTVTTVLNDLRNKEIIKFDRRRLLIRSLEKLEHELQVA